MFNDDRCTCGCLRAEHGGGGLARTGPCNNNPGGKSVAQHQEPCHGFQTSSDPPGSHESDCPQTDDEPRDFKRCTCQASFQGHHGRGTPDAPAKRECIHCGHAERSHVDTRGIPGQRQVPWCNDCNSNDVAGHSFHAIRNTERGPVFEELDPSSPRYHGHTGGGGGYAGKQWVHQHDNGGFPHAHFRSGIHTTDYHPKGYQENVPDQLPPDIRDKDINKSAKAPLPHADYIEGDTFDTGEHNNAFRKLGPAAMHAHMVREHGMPSGHLDVADRNFASFADELHERHHDSDDLVLPFKKSMDAPNCNKCGQPLAHMDRVQFRDKYTKRIKPGLLDLQATCLRPNAVMVSVTHKQARGGGITSQNQAVWRSDLSHVECPVKKGDLVDFAKKKYAPKDPCAKHSAYEKDNCPGCGTAAKIGRAPWMKKSIQGHSHEDDGFDDHRTGGSHFTGYHEHEMTEGDDHTHAGAKCGRTDAHGPHGSGTLFCVGNMSAPIAGRPAEASASAVPDRVPKTWAKIKPKKEYPPEITARARYVPSKREADVGHRVDTILALRHKFHGTATDRMGKSAAEGEDCVTCGHGQSVHKMTAMGFPLGECKLCACDNYKRESTCVDCQHPKSEHHSVHGIDSTLGAIEDGCDKCRCIKFREPSVGRWARPRERKIPADHRIDTALALRAKWHGTGHSKMDKSMPEGDKHTEFPESGADLYNHMLTGHGRGTKTGWKLFSGSVDLEHPRVKAQLHTLHLGDHRDKPRRR